jgi:POT family proton-dependent oligopeptide transporter
MDGAAMPAAAGAMVSTKHPPAIWFFFWGEFAERSSYYGMRTILSLYLTTALAMTVTRATPIYTTFKMGCYFLPLLGGYIADRWLGRYWTIVGFSVPYVLGHFILGIPTEVALIIALALLAGGSGVIKPNISTLMGQTYDQLRPGQERLRSSAFLWFYFAINIGAFVSTFALPIIRDDHIRDNLAPDVLAKAEKLASEKGEHIAKFSPINVIQEANAHAFLFPAWLMVVSLGIFAAGKKFYAVETVERHQLTPEERRLQWQTVRRLFGIFGLIVLVWVGYEHNDTIWVFFIRDYVNLQVPGLSQSIAPDHFQFLNPLFVIIMVPTFNFLFAYLDPQVKIFTPMRKVMAGFVLTAVSIGIMMVAGFLVQGHTEHLVQDGKTMEVSTAKVSVWWPVLAIILLTVGEVLWYVTMLELAYTAAPKSMKGFISACFLVTNTLGNFVNIGWTPLYGGSLTDAPADRGPVPPGQFFALTMALVIVAAILFLYVGKKFERGQAQSA